MDAFTGGGAKETPRMTRVVEKPWVEKYRPKNIDEVAMQEEVVKVLKRTLEGHDMPHMLMYGPPGTGKTSTILAIAKQLYGPVLIKERVLELNASDERGIKVVREKVKRFAQLTANTQGADGYPCPGYKIIIMDECDSMTDSAQSALRRTMEQYSTVTRFCLICNYVSRIIEPLASRCAKFRFKPLNRETQLTRLLEVQEKEGVDCKSPAMERLISLTGGDMRQAITFLQSAHRLHDGAEITASDVEEIAGVVSTPLLEDFIVQCKTNSFEKMQEACDNIIAEGFSVNCFLDQVHDVVIAMENTDLTDTQKAVIAEKIAKADHALVDGADEHLQLVDVAATIMRNLCK